MRAVCREHRGHVDTSVASETCPRQGFTLIELLIASTMMAILIAGLSGQIHGGLRVWKEATEHSAALQKERIALDRLQRDLANGVVFEVRSDPALYGKELGQLEAPDFGLASLGWYLLAPGGRTPGGVRWVSYRCRQLEDTYALVRTERTVAEVRSQTEATPYAMLEGCSGMRVSYAYKVPNSNTEIEWRRDWNRPVNTLPGLIKVELDLGAGGVIERTIAIPSGLLVEYQPESGTGV